MAKREATCLVCGRAIRKQLHKQLLRAVKGPGKAKRIKELERELLRPGSWPCSNPKAATARWHLICELADLRDEKVKVTKQWVIDNYPAL